MGEEGTSIPFALFHLTGRTITTKTVKHASSFRMNLEGEESGMYLIEIRTVDGGKEVLKVVKE